MSGDTSNIDKNKIIVALDYPELAPAVQIAKQLDPKLCRLKVGKELFTSCGPAAVEQLQSYDFDIFLDLKFHDIPNTVAKSVSAATRLGVWMVNVHASGGRKMMETTRNELEKVTTKDRPYLIAVTALTSMDEGDLSEIGFSFQAEQLVERLALLTKDSGLDGVVCSPQEVSLLKTLLGKDFLLVTPGIRPSNSSQDDQKRTMTPKEALESGSDYLVIGRPITQSENPLKALETIYKSLN